MTNSRRSTSTSTPTASEARVRARGCALMPSIVPFLCRGNMFDCPGATTHVAEPNHLGATGSDAARLGRCASHRGCLDRADFARCLSVRHRDRTSRRNGQAEGEPCRRRAAGCLHDCDPRHPRTDPDHRPLLCRDGRHQPAACRDRSAVDRDQRLPGRGHGARHRAGGLYDRGAARRNSRHPNRPD